MVPEKKIALLNKMREEFAPDENYKKYRSILRSLKPPCIPYIGLYLKTLTFNEENANVIGKHRVNFSKVFH